MLKQTDLFLKVLFDIAFAFLGLCIATPVFLLIAFWIQRDSEGPVFYGGVRVGRFGVPFRIFKFRTMVVNADKIGGPSTADDDVRITKAGRILRKYKLDELPQLINVLKGDMSLVGPRPEVPVYVDMFTEQERAILTARPGITDWASLWNSDEGAVLAGSLDPDKTYEEKIRPEKIRLQLEYVRRRSLWTDLTIVLRTLAAVLLRDNPVTMSELGEKGEE